MSMSKTKEEILAEKLHVTVISLSYTNHNPPTNPTKILEAMEEYGNQEARAFANWLSNTVVHGRTMDKLFKDYKDEIGYDV